MSLSKCDVNLHLRGESRGSLSSLDGKQGGHRISPKSLEQFSLHQVGLQRSQCFSSQAIRVWRCSVSTRKVPRGEPGRDHFHFEQVCRSNILAMAAAVDGGDARAAAPLLPQSPANGYIGLYRVYIYIGVILG